MDIKYPKQNAKSLKEEDLLWKNIEDEAGDQTYYRTIENEVIDNGTIEILNIGYGSSHDGDRILLAICDACIEENLAEGTLLYFSKYMTKIGLDEDIDKSKNIYQRRTRLDGLVGEE